VLHDVHELVNQQPLTERCTWRELACAEIDVCPQRQGAGPKKGSSLSRSPIGVNTHMREVMAQEPIHPLEHCLGERLPATLTQHRKDRVILGQPLLRFGMTLRLRFWRDALVPTPE
jgi:hypothetical protein